MSLNRRHVLVRVRRREPRPLYSHLEIDTLRSLDMYRLPEVWGRMKADTMLHGVNAGDVHTTHHEPDSRFPTDTPSSACPPVYIYCLPTNDPFILLSFPVLLIVDGHSECPL